MGRGRPRRRARAAPDAGRQSRRGRDHEQGAHVRDPDRGTQHRTDRDAGDSAPLTIAKARPRAAKGTARATRDRQATCAAPAAAPWYYQPEITPAIDLEQESGAGQGITDQAGQHPAMTDPVTEPARQVLGEHAGGEERGHDGTDQPGRVVALGQVDRQQRQDGAGAGPLQEDGRREGEHQQRIARLQPPAEGVHEGLPTGAAGRPPARAAAG